MNYLGPIMIEWTISIGNIAATIIAMGTMISFFFGLKANIDVIRTDLRHLEDQQRTLNEALKQLGTILTQIAVQDNRMNMIEKDIDELRHGAGFIK